MHKISSRRSGSGVTCGVVLHERPLYMCTGRERKSPHSGQSLLDPILELCEVCNLLCSFMSPSQEHAYERDMRGLPLQVGRMFCPAEKIILRH